MSWIIILIICALVAVALEIALIVLFAKEMPEDAFMDDYDD